MSYSLLLRAKKSEFAGVYTKETKNGLAFIVRVTVNKKTKTQTMGYEEHGMCAYEVFKAKLNLAVDL